MLRSVFNRTLLETQVARIKAPRRLVILKLSLRTSKAISTTHLVTMSSEPTTKKQKTSTEYTLLYHPGIPGRGEYVRLVFEAAQVPYSDPANASKAGAKEVYSHLGGTVSYDSDGNPPPFAPPMLKVTGAGKNGGDLLLNQTTNFIFYLGSKLGLAGDDDIDGFYVNELALTALDLSNETHDTHHPIASIQYYEEQKEEALKKAKDFRETRIPKFMGYFERVLKGNEKGDGKYLVGGKLTYADTTLWQVLDGLHFAFPKEIAARKEEFPTVLGTFYESVKEEKGIKAYLESGRRLEFSMGLFRKYPELDRE
jgi:glutathione S-transferase